MQPDAPALAARSTTNRSRITNDPRHIPGRDGRKTQERRRRDLVAIYIDALGGADAVTDLQRIGIRKAAELTAAAEMLRARVLSGDATADLGALVKVENAARRAVRALGVEQKSERGVVVVTMTEEESRL